MRNPPSTKLYGDWRDELSAKDLDKLVAKDWRQDAIDSDYDDRSHHRPPPRRQIDDIEY